MSQQPVYRYPPKSHAYNCPCARCVQCRRKPMDSGLWLWPLLLVLGGVGAAVKAAAHHPAVTVTVAAGIALVAVTAGAVAFLNRRGSRPPKGRLRVEATPQPPATAVPACWHLNAFKVDSSFHRRYGAMVVLCCWCPDCATDLPANYRLFCCGCEPGDGISPAVHAYNCPHGTLRP